MTKNIRRFIEKLNTSNPRTKRLMKNVAGVTILRYSSYVLELIKVPILLTYLDNARYGVWLTLISILLWTNNFDLGLNSGLRYKLTEAITNNDVLRCKKLVSTAYVSLSVIMMIGFFIIGVVSLFLNWNSILNVSDISNSELIITVEVILFIFMARFVAELLMGVLNADQKNAVASIFMPIGTIISLFVVLCLNIFSHNSLLLASIAMALPYLIVLIAANFCFYCNSYFAIRPNIKFYDKGLLRDIYSLGLKFFVSQFSTLVVFSSSNIIITQLIGPESVTIYNVARQYFYLPITFIAIFLASFSAPITEAYVKNDMNWVRNIMSRLKKIAVLLSIFIVFMLLISDFVFDIWTRGRVVVPLSLSLFLCLYAILNMFASPYGEFLGGIGKFQVRVYVSYCKIVLFIPIAILFVQLWNIEGLVLAICLVNTLPNLVMGEIQYKKIITGKATGVWNR